MKYYVYKLIDPENNEPFYIAKGSNGRCYQHLSLAKRNSHYNKKLERKIWSIWNNNKEVITKIHFRSNNENTVYDEEHHLILKYGLHNLCNLEAGDRHRFGEFKHSKETKDLIRLKNIERFKNPKEREKISLGTIKRFSDPEERKRISKLTIKGMTKEIRKHISKMRKGKSSSLNKKIEIICPICGTKKMRSPSHSHMKFCSQLCFGKYKTKRNSFKKICNECSKEFTQIGKRNKSFCSNKCARERLYKLRKRKTWLIHAHQENKKVEGLLKE